MLSFFLRDVLDEIWDLIESVSEVFLPALKEKGVVEFKFPISHMERLLRNF